MAVAQLIDLSNYDTLLVQSTQSRTGTPDGNIYFNTTTGVIEFITKQELAQVDLGSGLEDNPLDETLGIKLEAAYAFENQERRTDENLRKFNRWLEGNFKFGGAYNFVNSRKPSLAGDREILRGSGWSEYASDGGIDRIYFGNKGLSNIESGSQPFYQLSDNTSPNLNSISPVDYAKTGQFDEAVQVLGNTGNTPTDATAGDFDTRAYQITKIRTYGYNYDEKDTVNDLGIAELGGYSTGFAVNESTHLTTGDYTLADVYTAQISPWTGMTLVKLATPQTESGFNESDGDFTWILNNTVPGSLAQCVAFLDALSQSDDDIDSGSETVTYGKRVGTWYTYNATGQVVTRSGADSLGLFIENIPTADEQSIVFTDDSGNTKTYPFSVNVEATIGSTAKGDSNAWYHSFFGADYNTSSAITVEDASGSDVKGLASTADGNNKIIFAFDYDGDTVGGTAGTDKNCVFLCEGDGGATQAKTLYTITRITTVSFSCSPSVENNV